jgi:hypothetical protein
MARACYIRLGVLGGNPQLVQKLCQRDVVRARKETKRFDRATFTAAAAQAVTVQHRSNLGGDLKKLRDQDSIINRDTRTGHRFFPFFALTRERIAKVVPVEQSRYGWRLLLGRDAELCRFRTRYVHARTSTDRSQADADLRAAGWAVEVAEIPKPE